MLKKQMSAKFFAPTNLFCGPIELRDNKGKELTSLKPFVSSPDVYPATFSLGFAEKHNPFPPRGFGYPEALACRPGNLARFQLGDYFNINKQGDYKLTVWPKVYERSDANSDLCERIDLPPVSVTFHWDAPDAPK